MDIAALNVRITFQQNETVVDRYKNHVNEWTDYFTCYATASMTGGGEAEAAGTTNVSEVIDFTTRYCSELSAVSADHYRILLDGQVYNILSVNPMGFKRNSLKFHCEKERRQ